MTAIYTVAAPGQFANAQLNGAECVIAHVPTAAFPAAVEVLLLNGPSAHRYWWISTDHLTPAETDQ